MLFPLYRKLCQVAILWDKHSAEAPFLHLSGFRVSVFPNRFQSEWCLCRTGVRFYVFHFLRYKTPLPMVQWSPSHPGLHSHFPSLHCPCSAQWEWQVRSSQVGPTQPSSHWHIPREQTPWLPQSRVHSSAQENKSTPCGTALSYCKQTLHQD